jgi:osomolarity two-component system sensor histidine kinase CHK1
VSPHLTILFEIGLTCDSFFTASKFDQYKRDFSFFTLVRTLQDLIRQVLSEPPQSLARWRTETIRAFDGDAAVLIDVIPELKLLLGADFKVEPLANLGPVERESRFRDAFGRLLAICKSLISGSLVRHSF